MPAAYEKPSWKLVFYVWCTIFWGKSTFDAPLLFDFIQFAFTNSRPRTPWARTRLPPYGSHVGSVVRGRQVYPLNLPSQRANESSNWGLYSRMPEFLYTAVGLMRKSLLSKGWSRVKQSVLNTVTVMKVPNQQCEASAKTKSVKLFQRLMHVFRREISVW